MKKECDALLKLKLFNKAIANRKDHNPENLLARFGQKKQNLLAHTCERAKSEAAPKNRMTTTKHNGGSISILREDYDTKNVLEMYESLLSLCRRLSPKDVNSNSSKAHIDCDKKLQNVEQAQISAQHSKASQVLSKIISIPAGLDSAANNNKRLSEMISIPARLDSAANNNKLSKFLATANRMDQKVFEKANANRKDLNRKDLNRKDLNRNRHEAEILLNLLFPTCERVKSEAAPNSLKARIDCDKKLQNVEQAQISAQHSKAQIPAQQRIQAEAEAEAANSGVVVEDKVYGRV